MKNYIINPPVFQARVESSVYKRVYEQTAKWEAVKRPDDLNLCGNICPIYDYDKTEKKFKFKNRNISIRMYDVISSALLLYRLLCLFKCDNIKSEGPEGYKCVWGITLKHKETGEYVMFSEWKGAAGIWTKYYEEKQLPKSFSKDILLLLNELCAKNCPHPYDGCVAGSVA